MHPALGTIIAAQTRPTWLATTSIAATSHTGPRFYGLGDRHDPLQAVVMEIPHDRSDADEDQDQERVDDVDDGRVRPRALAKIYDYALTSTPKAADLLAGWVLLPVPMRGIAREGPPRVVDIYGHAQGQPLMRRRIAVRARDGRAAIVEGAPSGLARHGQYDRGALTESLHRQIRDVCAVGRP